MGNLILAYQNQGYEQIIDFHRLCLIDLPSDFEIRHSNIEFILVIEKESFY